MSWREVIPGVYRYQESCNVYAVQGSEGMLVIDAGTGRLLDDVSELPAAPADLEVTLVGPQGWRGESASLQAGPRCEVSCELSIIPDGPCRRQPFAVDLVAGGRPFGQVAEALMTVGGQEF